MQRPTVFGMPCDRYPRPDGLFIAGEKAPAPIIRPPSDKKSAPSRGRIFHLREQSNLCSDLLHKNEGTSDVWYWGKRKCQPNPPPPPGYNRNKKHRMVKINFRVLNITRWPSAYSICKINHFPTMRSVDVEIYWYAVYISISWTAFLLCVIVIEFAQPVELRNAGETPAAIADLEAVDPEDRVGGRITTI